VQRAVIEKAARMESKARLSPFPNHLLAAAVLGIQ
jgi:hypothetical protein